MKFNQSQSGLTVSTTWNVLQRSTFAGKQNKPSFFRLYLSSPSLRLNTEHMSGGDKTCAGIGNIGETKQKQKQKHNTHEYNKSNRITLNITSKEKINNLILLLSEEGKNPYLFPCKRSEGENFH
ncbi:hypothetical protein PoB_000087200 [Plakobranchus ocellatus]|uniref:Uncharacterized protein n=1 Tax=Plakobranchus ocellatus TaxID=259542 RepID=A0AAV3XW53_9GAST|nr:hypothetical protein PoB_000087200 [Plakobranchus ocellatus]